MPAQGDAVEIRPDQVYLQEVQDHLHSLSQGYCLLLTFFCVKLFSLVRSIDIQNA